MLANQGGLEPFFDQPLAAPLGRVDPALQRRAIWLSLQPSPPCEASAFNRIRAFSSFCAGWCPLWIRAVRCSRSSLLSVTTYFFTAISFLAINPLRQQRRNHRIRQTPRNQ